MLSLMEIGFAVVAGSIAGYQYYKEVNSMQKIEMCGADGNRFYWNVVTDSINGEYRSRCGTATRVRTVLTGLGHTVKSVTKAKA